MSGKSTAADSSNPYLDPSLLMFDLNGDNNAKSTDHADFLHQHHFGALKSVDRNPSNDSNNLSQTGYSYNPYLQDFNPIGGSTDEKQSSNDPSSNISNFLEKERAKTQAHMQKLNQRLNRGIAIASISSSNNNNNRSNGRGQSRSKFQRSVILEPLASYQQKKVAKMTGNTRNSNVGNNGTNSNTNNMNINNTMSSMASNSNNNNNNNNNNNDDSNSDENSNNRSIMSSRSRPSVTYNNASSRNGSRAKNKNKNKNKNKTSNRNTSSGGSSRNSSSSRSANRNSGNNGQDTQVSSNDVLDFQYGTLSRQSQ